MSFHSHLDAVYLPLISNIFVNLFAESHWAIEHNSTVLLQDKKVYEEQPVAPPWSPPAPAVPAPPIPAPPQTNFHHKGDSVQQLKGVQHRVHFNPDPNYHHQQYGMK